MNKSLSQQDIKSALTGRIQINSKRNRSLPHKNPLKSKQRKINKTHNSSRTPSRTSSRTSSRNLINKHAKSIDHRSSKSNSNKTTRSISVNSVYSEREINNLKKKMLSKSKILKKLNKKKPKLLTVSKKNWLRIPINTYVTIRYTNKKKKTKNYVGFILNGIKFYGSKKFLIISKIINKKIRRYTFDIEKIISISVLPNNLIKGKNRMPLSKKIISYNNKKTPNLKSLDEAIEYLLINNIPIKSNKYVVYKKKVNKKH